MPNVSNSGRVRGTHAGGGNSGYSIEDGSYVLLEERFLASYLCPNGHAFDIPFHINAEVPAVWPCVKCDESGVNVAADPTALVERVPHPHEPARPGCWYTNKHRADVYSRRTDKELRDVLAERLAVRRADKEAGAW